MYTRLSCTFKRPPFQWRYLFAFSFLPEFFLHLGHAIQTWKTPTSDIYTAVFFGWLLCLIRCWCCGSRKEGQFVSNLCRLSPLPNLLYEYCRSGMVDCCASPPAIASPSPSQLSLGRQFLPPQKGLICTSSFLETLTDDDTPSTASLAQYEQILMWKRTRQSVRRPRSD